MAHNVKETKECGDRKLDQEKIRLQQARWESGVFEISPEDTDYLKVISGARERTREMRGYSNVLNFLGGARGNLQQCRFANAQGNLEPRC